MDIIQLLPDSIANQIAAGEVIQRPASAVKELLENAVDAGSTYIKLIVKEAGRTLVQVIDNGCGMSETDARLSFERHATSKIREASDLFAIHTMGFRGEALASIAAISHVELKTRRIGDELGTIVAVEGSEVKLQEHCQCPEGTSIAMKNVFYNVPARRNFLKSDTVELKHILEEFERVALAHPHIGFSLHNNNVEVYQLKPGNFRQRIVGILGAGYNERLVPVSEKSSIINIEGFVVKPEFARKTRGEQFFFVNKRFIKDGYLNHSVSGAFSEMLPQGSYPGYFLHIEIDPARIDVNIHPTKTEIKFDDERAIYSIVKSAVRRALGIHNIAPSIDFEQEQSFNVPYSKLSETPKEPTITVNADYNPFKQNISKGGFQPNKTGGINPYEDLGNAIPHTSYQKEFPLIYKREINTAPDNTFENKLLTLNSSQDNFQQEDTLQKKVSQLHNRYIVSQVRSGMMLIDQQAAHERILYEKYIQMLENNRGVVQQLLFPSTIELPSTDAALLHGLLGDINKLGFDISEFGRNTFVINGIPADLVGMGEQHALEQFLEQYKQGQNADKLNARDKLANAMACTAAIKSGNPLSEVEMRSIIEELFACKVPGAAPNGRKTITIVTLEELEKRF